MTLSKDGVKQEKRQDKGFADDFVTQGFHEIFFPLFFCASTWSDRLIESIPGQKPVRRFLPINFLGKIPDHLYEVCTLEYLPIFTGWETRGIPIM